MKRIPSLVINPEDWTPGGQYYPESMLHCTITINGIHFHVEAYAIKYDKDLVYSADDEAYAAVVSEVAAQCNYNNSWPDPMPITIGDTTRDYVVAVYSFAYVIAMQERAEINSYISNNPL